MSDPFDEVGTRHNAKDLRTQLGAKLLGRLVGTEAIGSWPGGVCRVVELSPDPAAPEIVFTVRHVESEKEIGVFWWETVLLLPPRAEA